jgi:hypothetical protein
MGGDFDNSGDGDGGSGYNRPRRPNADTITYLRGLPLDVDSAKAEVDSFLTDGEDDDFPQSLAAALSALDEVRLEIASLAGDEQGSQSVEILAHLSAPYSETAARVLLSACSGYHLHLATHRYGSHVVQTILQLAASSSSENDLALHSEAPQFGSFVDTLPSLSDLILEMVEELKDSATELATHVCGSHVLRTLLCVLGGVNLLSSGQQNDNKVDSGAVLRGRKKSKKKKKKPAPDDASKSAPHAGTMRVVYRTNSRLNPDEFAPQLETLAYSLLGEPTGAPGVLQQHACHPSAGPLLIILLRVLTYSSTEAREMVKNQTLDVNAAIADFRLGITRPEPAFQMGSVAHEMAKRLLCWNDSLEEQKQVGDVIYGYSGEPRGSHILETLFRLCPDEMYNSIVKYGDLESPSSLQDYSEHNVSNFVVQTFLTTIRSKDQAERVLKAIEKVISCGLAVDPSKKRRGILWRTCELAAKYRVGQESLLKAVRMGFGSLNESNADDTEKTETSEGKKKKQRKKASALEIKDCIPLLINLKSAEADGGRADIDAAGARAVYQMLHFSPRLCEDVLKGILEGLSETEIEILAKDGLGSRCILDGILDGPPNTSNFASAFKSLFIKLQGRWTSLSTDRVGHHSVKKLFHALPKIDDKAKLVEELVDGGNRLNGNAMGRSVAEECLVHIYSENRKEWRKAMSKTQTKETNFMDDIVAETNKTGIDNEGKSKSKRKRKRKRPEKEDNDDDAKPLKAKSERGSDLATDAIIDAMTVPVNT